jgi:hypothetical protein
VMRIGGLPIQCGATYFGPVTFGFISQFNYTALAMELTAIVQLGQQYMSLYEAFDNGAAVLAPAANFTNVATDLIFSGMYLP